MTGFEDMTVEELESKLEEYEEWGWSANKAAIEKELEIRRDEPSTPTQDLPVEEMTAAELSEYSTEKKGGGHVSVCSARFKIWGRWTHGYLSLHARSGKRTLCEYVR